MVNGVGQSNVTNPTGTQSINSNKGNVSNSGIGMVKPEGYDGFMKGFEVVGVHDLTPISDETQIIMLRNKNLNTEELEFFYFQNPK